MSLSDLQSWEIGLACLAALSFAFLLKNIAQSTRLPPGPNPIPILGNLSEPKDWRSDFKRYADKYGDSMTMKVMCIPMIILNSRRAASDVLEKRAGSTYKRPVQVMAQDLVGLGPDPSTTSDPKLHKEYRRLFSLAMSPRAVQAYWPHQIHQCRQIAREMLLTPDNYIRSIRRAVSAIAIRVAYGFDIKTEDDPMLLRAEKAMRIVEEVFQPYHFLVDVFPILKYIPEWVPGAGFKRLGREYKDHYDRTREIPFNMVMDDITKGTAKPSFITALLDDQYGVGVESHNKAELAEKIKWCAESINSAGSDTSAAAIHNFIAAMVLFPEKQVLAQAELDAVIGREQLPDITDRERLPYCWAVVQETLRWQPIARVGLLHRMGKDEVFDGYLLPEETMIFANVWAMSRDERDYPSAASFQPERYLGGESDATRSSFGFGFGRRVCPGQHLAEATVFGAVTTLLWGLKMELRKGEKIEWKEELGVNGPKPFAIEVTPRFPGVAEILRSSLAE